MPKILSKQPIEFPKKKSTLTVSPLVHALINELLLPRIAKLRPIVWTRMVAEMRGEDEEDWWPDYAIYSHTHAYTDIKGLICHMQNSVKGLGEDLGIIRSRFENMYSGIKKSLMRNMRRRYRLALVLIRDIMDFVYHFDRCCSKMLEKRRSYADCAGATKATEERIRLKIFDENAFVQMHTKMVNLKSFLQALCDLFVCEQTDLQFVAKACKL